MAIESLRMQIDVSKHHFGQKDAALARFLRPESILSLWEKLTNAAIACICYLIMINQRHLELGLSLQARIQERGIAVILFASNSGSVYLYLVNSRMKIRIADHAKHDRSFFRYNLRTDLHTNRIQKVSGQQIYFFTGNGIDALFRRVLVDFKSERLRTQSGIVKQKSNKRSKKRVSKGCFR